MVDQILLRLLTERSNVDDLLSTAALNCRYQAISLKWRKMPRRYRTWLDGNHPAVTLTSARIRFSMVAAKSGVAKGTTNAPSAGVESR
jgi:hypothetical protein